MLERVIENWLVSLNERQYQIPFCQLLQAEGERILRISRHQADELGVDVLSLGQSGEAKAYQLKRGDIGMSEWRANEGEIVQLVGYDPAHSGIPRDVTTHQSFIVTNGEFKGPVLNAIHQRNITWERRNLGPLISVARDELITRFINAQGQFFPTTLEDVSTFLELYTERGEMPLNKQKFSSFLDAVIPDPEETKIERRHILQAASSLVLFTSYILKNKTLMANHWASFEAWTMAAAYIASLGEQHKDAWEFSFSLCVLQAKEALGALAEECDRNKSLSQGFTLSDVFIHPSRRIIVAGLMAAFCLVTTNDEERSGQRSAARRVLEREFYKPAVWGESSFPYIFAAMLALEQTGKQAAAENMAAACINLICKSNSKDGSGLPNPYWGPERCMRLSNSLSDHEVERFAGFSYSLEYFVEFLARRWRRVTLRLLWERISHVIYLRTQPKGPREWLLWNSDTAQLLTYRPSTPESWHLLRERSERRTTAELPGVLRSNKEFAVFFSIVYPHRMQPTLAASIERLVQ